MNHDDLQKCNPDAGDAGIIPRWITGAAPDPSCGRRIILREPLRSGTLQTLQNVGASYGL